MGFSKSKEVFRPIIPAVTAFNDQEIGDLNIGFTTAVLFTVCTAWYFGTMLFYRKDKKDTSSRWTISLKR